MAATTVRIRLIRPGTLGDTVPANGYVECVPTLRRHVEAPEDAIVLPAKFTARLGEALYDADGETVLQAAEPGVAWAKLEPTDAGPDANQWAWRFSERTSNGVTRYCVVPTSGSVVEYGDLTDVDPDTFDPLAPPDPAWAAALAAETEAREDADTALTAAIAAVESSDVDSVAGLTGAVTADGLKSALNLPGDTANDLLAEVANRLAAEELLGEAIETEATARAAADNALDTRLDVIETELDTWVPGTELGSASRNSQATTTATTLGTATAITSLSVTVTGKGRPVDIKFFCAGIWHSVANTFCVLVIDMNGTTVATGSVSSPSTTNGPSKYVEATSIVLTDGVSYTFTVKRFGLAAGTMTTYAAAGQAMKLSVVSR